VAWFPGAAANVIPVFRFNILTPNPILGGSSATSTVNGLLEINSALSWQGTGTKTFRNGIMGTGAITQTSTGTFSVNGTAAQLGGSEAIALNSGGSLTIGSTTTAALTSNKTVDTGT